jgi:predicted SAM-dependent methyltransferase
MIENGSASVIYASHVLEYFGDEEAPRILAEWFSKLKIGGLLRLGVPDFSKLCEVYKQTKDLKLISGPIFGLWRTEGADVLGDRWLHHRCLYDLEKLSHRLFNVGFRTVQKWDWRKVFVGDLAGFDDYSQAYIPHMDKQKGTLISLNIEALK